MNPSAAEIRECCARLLKYDLIIIGTINAADHPGQAALVNTLLKEGRKVIAVALRMPYDLAAYPEAPTYLCTYSILPPAMEALADALWGESLSTESSPLAFPLNTSLRVVRVAHARKIAGRWRVNWYDDLRQK